MNNIKEKPHKRGWPKGKPRPKQTREHRLKIGLKVAGKNNGMFGVKHSEQVRRKIAKANSGENSHLWKGGVTPLEHKIRNNVEYKLWRDAVYKRDNWTCVWCGKKDVKLSADHIKPFAYFPELRFAIDNGRTLCRPCHKTTDTYGRLADKFKYQ